MVNMLLNFINYSIFCKNKLFKNKYIGLRLLCYHSVSNSDFFFPASNIPVTKFTDHIEYLVKNEMKCLNFNEADGYFSGKRLLRDSHYLITFDDGFANLIDNVLPIIETFKIYVIVFITTSTIGKKTQFNFVNWIGPKNPNKSRLEENFYPLAEKSITHLAKHPFVKIGSHGHRHVDMRLLTKEELMIDLKRSKSILEDIVGESVDYFAYPYGLYNKSIFFEASKIYKFQFGVNTGLNRSVYAGDSPLLRHSFNYKSTFKEFELFINGCYDWKGSFSSIIKKI